MNPSIFGDLSKRSFPYHFGMNVFYPLLLHFSAWISRAEMFGGLLVGYHESWEIHMLGKLIVSIAKIKTSLGGIV